MAALVSAGLVIGLPTTTRADSGFSLPEAEARCLIANKAAYLATGADPVVILAPACPETDMARGMAQLSTNSSIPEITASGSGSRFVIYSRAELECLSEAQVQFQAGTALLPARPACAP